MKFLIAFAAVLAVAVTGHSIPGAHHAYTPYVATAPAVYGVHNIYKRGIYAPIAYTGNLQGAYVHPYAAVYYRQRRGVDNYGPYHVTATVYPYYEHHGAVHFRERRGSGSRNSGVSPQQLAALTGGSLGK